MKSKQILWSIMLAAIAVAPLALALPAAAGVAPTVYDTAAIPNAAAASVEKMAAANAALAELEEAQRAVEAAVAAYNAARDRFLTAQQAAQNEILQVIQVADGVYRAHVEDTPPPKIELPPFTAPAVPPTPEPQPAPAVPPVEPVTPVTPAEPVAPAEPLPVE